VLASKHRTHAQVPLVDGLALIVGYGMAAELFRACWPSRPPSPALTIPGVALYIWLGLALSGPVLLIWRGLARPPAGPSGVVSSHPARATWAELAWLLIGLYWIVIGLLVIRARLQEFQLADTLLFGLIPFIVSLGFWLCRPKASADWQPSRGWTHITAVVLLATWPIAWICLIVLAKVLG
jgi:hypothetical protein